MTVACLTDYAGREVYARVARVAATRYAITWDTGITTETDAIANARGIVVVDLSTLHRVAALDIQRVRGAQPGGEYEQRGHEHQGEQRQKSRHARKVRRSDAESQSGGRR